MPTTILRDATQQDSGFLMLSGKEPTSNPGARDVVLMSLPLPNDSPLATFIRSHKNTEHSSTVTTQPVGFSVTFLVEGSIGVRIDIGPGNKGVWSAQGIDEGTCEALT